jgi:alkaline phosphatase D
MLAERRAGMRRRDFLKGAGCFVATASVGGMLSGCSDEERSGSADGGLPNGKSKPGSYSFPQGVASGDPRPTSVMLWTRVEPKAKTDAKVDVPIRLEVSQDESFKKLVAHADVAAPAKADHTVRVLVESLDPDARYYYRFVAGADQSRVGRTWTAPTEDADVAVRFAWASCQDYTAGVYGAYRRMLNDDDAAPEAEQLRFVLFVGDFIYETRGEGFQMALDEALQPVMLVDEHGKPRQLPAFPSGGGMLKSGATYAKTTDDYRHLYKTYLTDPDLQDARARWPFVSMWDDHEFTNDCWQTQANYTDEESFDEPSQQRKVAANQAWFEFVPAILTEAEAMDGVPSAAKNFTPVSVQDAAYSDPIEVTEPNNQKAIASATVYRRLRFGKHVDLLLTDNRSYRSDHAVPEQVTFGNPLIFDPRAGLSLDLVNAFDAGKTANGGNPMAMISGGFENTRKDSEPGSMLGVEQKKWWKQALKASTATFKVWGNSVPLMRFRLDTTNVAIFPGDLLLSDDAWDGFATERRELMSFLKDESVRNVVSLSGDHHAHFAGLVYDDFDAQKPVPVMADFCAAGISSSSQFASVASAIGAKATPALEAIVGPVLKLITYDATTLGGSDKAVVNLNTLIRYGSGSAMAASSTNDLAAIEAARKDAINPHLRYADTAANGYGLATFDGQSAQVTLVTIERPIVARGKDGAMVRGKASFELPATPDGGTPSLAEPQLSGKKPFPLS